MKGRGKDQLIREMQVREAGWPSENIHAAPEYIWKVKFFFCKLLVGKKSFVHCSGEAVRIGGNLWRALKEGVFKSLHCLIKRAAVAAN